MSTKKKLIIILGSALVVRLILIAVFKTYTHPVTFEYENIVNNMLSGRGFVYDFLNVSYRSFNNPLYSYLCLVIYMATNHSYGVVLLVQSIFSILLAGVVFQIAKTMFNERVGLISAAIAAFHPGFLYYDVFNLVPLSIDAFIIAAVAYMFLKGKDNPTVLNMSLVGSMIGLGVLSRGIIGVLMPFLIMYMLLCVHTISVKKKIKALFFLSLATFIVIAPWMIRNYIIHKELMIISTTGETFWRGNNKYAIGTSLTKDGKLVLDSWPKEFRNKVYALDEVGQKKFFEKEAMEYIRNNPVETIKLYFKKIYYYWWFSPQTGISYPKIYLQLYVYIYFFIALFSVVGVATSLFFRGKTIRTDALLLLFIFMGICLTQSLFYVEGRHKWLIEPLLMIFFSYGVLEMYEYMVNKIRFVMTKA